MITLFMTQTFCKQPALFCIDVECVGYTRESVWSVGSVCVVVYVE